MKTLLLLLAILLPSHASDAAQAERTIKFAGYAPNLVRWLPASRHDDYRSLAPSQQRIAALQQLGYGSVVVHQNHDLHIVRDKTVRETVSIAQLFLTATGIENNGNNGFWLDVNQQRAEIEAAYVVQPDGSVAEVDPDTLQLNSDNTNNLFTDSVYVTVPFAQLKPGSIAVLRYKVISGRNPVPLPWARSLYPVNFYPIEHFQVDVAWDDVTQKPEWKTDYSKLACEESSHALHCASREASTPIQLDYQMPSPYDVLPVLVLAEPSSWEAISKAMNKLTEQALSGGNKIAELAMQNSGGGIHNTIVSLSAFVSRNIRYVGIEHGKGGTVPRATAETLERRFGDCKDKTMLFVDLARHAGLNAYPVLTSSRRQSLTKLLLPNGSYFDHMLACVSSVETGELCLDLTDPDTTGGYLSFNLHGAVALVIGNDASVPYNLAGETYTWEVRNSAENQLFENGLIVEKLERQYRSHWAAGMRRALLAKSQVERERWLLDEYHSVMGDKVEPVFNVQGLEGITTVSILSTAEYRNAFNPSFAAYQEPEMWLNSLTKDFTNQNKYYPYDFKGVTYHSEISYQLPNGKTVGNVGPKLEYLSPWGSLHRHYRQKGAIVTAYTDLQMPRVMVPVEKVAEFNRFLELVRQESRLWFSLKTDQARTN